MNKKYDRTDQERDQSRRLEQGEAEKQKARQDGMRDRGQQQSGGIHLVRRHRELELSRQLDQHAAPEPGPQ